MRVVAVPAGTVQTSNIIQTHIMPQAMLKQGTHELNIYLPRNN